jgi:ATP-dependent Lon protease
VLLRALTGPLTPIEWREEDQPILPASPVEEVEGGLVVTH